MTSVDHRRMSEADRAGFVARSPEGHAAKSMHIKGHEEEWVRIQADTFRNWANVTLGEAGAQSVGNMETDFQDGTKLVTLVETLQKRKLRHNKKPINQHHELENISIALDAIMEDGIKLVNIGNTDIHNGNLKLILALLWSLIAHYQLGASNFPPKKLMLAWLKAVLPEDCNIKNFTTDWNNGINLSALLDYCKPGLMPNWRNLSPHNGPENCQKAMEVAEKYFKIPMVLDPEYLASPHLDELSGMTYLSYFMKEEDSPGYYATLDWVKNQIPNQRINNFRTDWNDGLAASSLVKAKGGPVPGYREMDNYPENWVSNLEVALDGGYKIGVPPVMEPRDMANPNVQYLGVMAWVAQFQWIPDKLPPGERLEIHCNTSKAKVGEECNFNIDILDKEVDMDAISAEVIGPSGPVYMDFEMSPSGGRGVFQADEMGMHEVLVKNEGETVRGAPHFLRSMPQSKKDYDGIEPCAVGSTVEVLINPHHAAKPELLEVTAYSPTARPLGCPVSEENGTFYASFQPQEAGEWKIHVTYDGQDIDHSPFKCMVFNPRAIFIPDQDSARKARPDDPFTFTVDASKTGWGEVAIDVVFENRSIRRTFYVEEVAERIYKVTFTPQAKGKHRVYVYLHGMEVKGSPFSLRIGKDVRDPRKPATDIFRAISAPVAPPRSKKKRQSFREFKEENQQQQLFQSEHQTEEGVALLPIKKTLAFDCPADGATSADQIFVGIKDPNGKKIANDIKINHEEDTFTCEFTTSLVGEHTVEIIIGDDKVDATPNFFTYDASKIKVGAIPPGHVGTPVEFEVDGTGAGFGNLEIVVNGGRVTSHVSTGSNEKFSANFIPHDDGRHRIDVKFNGEKVPHSPWFCEVKDPNTPLMSPGLITGKIKAPSMPETNGYNYDSLNNNDYKKSTVVKDNLDSGSSTMLRSTDFNKIDNSYLDDYKETNTSFVTTTTTKKESSSVMKSKQSTSAVVPPVRNQKKFDDDMGPVVKASIQDKKTVPKMEPSKDFGSFSALLAPSLLTGKKTAASTEESIMSSSKTTTNTKETLDQSYDMDESYNSKMYSTTISKKVNPSKLSAGNSNGFKEESFLIKTDPGKMLRSVSPAANFRLEQTTSSSYSSLKTDSQSPAARRSKSPAEVRNSYFGKERSKSPEIKGSLFARDRSKSPEIKSSLFKSPTSDDIMSSLEKEPSMFSKEQQSKSVFSSSSIKEVSSIANKTITSSGGTTKSPVAAKRKTPPPVAKKTSSPGRSLIPKRTPSNAGIDEGGKKGFSMSAASKSVSSSKTGGTTTTTTSKSYSSYSESKSSSAGQQVKSAAAVRAGSPKTGKHGSKIEGKGNKGSTSPKLPSYRGMAEKCRFEGDTVRHFNAGKLAVFELKAPGGHRREDVQVNIISPEKRPHIPYKVVDEGNGRFRIEFTTVEVGSYVIDVTVNQLTVPNSPLIAKAYDAGLIKVTDIQDGVVGDLSTFRVDASRAGEGQLEISINDGDVPNAVQVLGGGKCLVTYTPDQPITHEIEVTFNGEQVSGSPFLCRVTDPSNFASGISPMTRTASDLDSLVSVELEHLGLIPVNAASKFTIRVVGGDDAELAVSVQGPTEDIPVKVTGNVKSGFTAEFLPVEVGIHMILVEYNGVAVGGTPYYSKAYDSENVGVSDIPKSVAGKTVTFAGSSRY